MKFESKHQHSKRILHVSGNFKNIVQTLAVRHQFDVAFRLLTHSRNNNYLIVGSEDVVSVTDLTDGLEICEAIGCPSVKSEVFQANWIEVRGTVYKFGCYVLTKVEGTVPVFLSVQYIIVHNGSIWLCGPRLSTQ
jgi:hypothetical protein